MPTETPTPVRRQLRAVRTKAPEASRRVAHRPRIRRAAAAVAGAALSLSVGDALGNVGGTPDQRITAGVAAGCFFLLAVIAVRAVSTEVAELFTARGGRSAGLAARVIVTASGYLVVAFLVLAVLDVPVQRLLLGGAISGVVLGIAAQQALGNVFAGTVLLLARPFTMGDHIRIRSGSLGGEFDGVVLSMSLTYVTVQTQAGLLRVPNAAMLAAAVGPVPALAPDQAADQPASADSDLVPTGPGPHLFHRHPPAPATSYGGAGSTGVGSSDAAGPTGPS